MMMRLSLLVVLCMMTLSCRMAHGALPPTKRVGMSMSKMKGCSNNGPMASMLVAGVTTVGHLFFPTFALADGEANLAFFRKDEIVKIGETIYNENDQEIIREKLARTKTNW